VNPDTLRRFLREDQLDISSKLELEAARAPTCATMYISRHIVDDDRDRPTTLVSVIIFLIGTETGVSVRNLRSKYRAVLPLERNSISGSFSSRLFAYAWCKVTFEVSDELFRLSD
jgi:hypothetical protein